MRTRLLVFISIVQSILFLTHWFVYASVAYFWDGAATSWTVKLAFGLLSVSFVLASLRGWYSHGPVVRLLYLFSAIWLGFASFFFCASILCWITYGISSVAHLDWPRAFVADIFFAIAVITGIYGLVNAFWLRVVPITVRLPNLPVSWRGRTAALVSDLHLGHIRNRRFVERIVRKLAALKPDVVFIAGDLYDGTAANFTRLAEPWKALAGAEPEILGTHKPSFGVYFIAGNHEEFYRNDEYLPPLVKAGIHALDNEKVELDGLQLVGVHYRDAANPARYQALLRNLRLDRNRPSILLLHAPVQLTVGEAEGISLQLSGHTHGGQFVPWTWVANRVWGAVVHGLQSVGKLQVFTTYGSGSWGPPFRVGTNSEIVLIRFE